MRYYQQFGATDPDAAIVTTDASGVRTLTPAAGLAFFAALQAAGSGSGPLGGQYMGAAVLTSAPDKEQVMLTRMNLTVTPGASPTGWPVRAVDWINAQLALGRSVIVSTNDTGGIAGLIGGPLPAQVNVGGAGTSNTILAAVSTKADEIAAASQPGAALIAPSKLAAATPALQTPGTPMKAGMGSSIAMAAVALLVVGGIYLAVRKKSPRSRY